MSGPSREPGSVARVDGARAWEIRYPTLTRLEGKVLRQHGELFIAWIPDAEGRGSCSPGIDDGKRIFLLDPRAIITDAATGETFYSPSSIPLERHSSEMAEWVRAHPEWEQEWVRGPAPTIPLAIPD